MTTNDLQELTANIRSADGLSIVRMAEHLGVPDHQLRNWENGNGLMLVAAYLTMLERSGRDIIIGPRRGVRA